VKRIICLLVFGCLICGVFTACGSKSDNEVTTTETKTDNEVAATETKTEAAIVDEKSEAGNEATEEKAQTDVKKVAEKADPVTLEVSASDKGETITFSRLPVSVDDLQNMDESYFKDYYTAAAIYVATCCLYEENTDECLDMIDYLNGPDDVSKYDIEYIRDRLLGKQYKTYSYFEGATPDNDYTASQPYTITVNNNPYSFDEENIAKLYMQSSGSDSERFITLRLKPSTGIWYFVESGLFADIKIPVSEDPWN